MGNQSGKIKILIAIILIAIAIMVLVILNLNKETYTERTNELYKYFGVYSLEDKVRSN